MLCHYLLPFKSIRPGCYDVELCRYFVVLFVLTGLDSTDSLGSWRESVWLCYPSKLPFFLSSLPSLLFQLRLIWQTDRRNCKHVHSPSYCTLKAWGKEKHLSNMKSEGYFKFLLSCTVEVRFCWFNFYYTVALYRNFQSYIPRTGSKNQYS